MWAAGRRLGVLQRAPGRGVDDAGHADALVALEFGDGALRGLAEHAVSLAGLVADFRELLLQEQHVVAVRAGFQRRRGERGLRGEEQGAGEDEGGFEDVVRVHDEFLS